MLLRYSFSFGKYGHISHKSSASSQHFVLGILTPLSSVLSHPCPRYLFGEQIVLSHPCPRYGLIFPYIYIRKVATFRWKIATKIMCVEYILFLNGSLSGSQACDGHTEGRAAHVVQAYLVAELNR